MTASVPVKDIAWGVTVATALLLQSAVAGLYVGLPTRCGVRTAGAGGVIGFLGIACPVCNKVLMLLFGSTLLLEYYEPVRLHLALGGVVLLLIAVWLKLTRRGCVVAALPLHTPNTHS